MIVQYFKTVFDLSYQQSLSKQTNKKLADKNSNSLLASKIYHLTECSGQKSQWVLCSDTLNCRCFSKRLSCFFLTSRRKSFWTAWCKRFWSARSSNRIWRCWWHCETINISVNDFSIEFSRLMFLTNFYTTYLKKSFVFLINIF